MAQHGDDGRGPDGTTREPRDDGAPTASGARGRVRVLIVAGDPVANALLGMLLDPAQYDPIFPLAGESPQAAMDRVQPPLVLLLDGTLGDADSDALFARAQRRGAAVVLFAPPMRGGVVDDLARRRGVAAFELPIDQAALMRVLGAAIARASAAGLWLLAVAALPALGRAARVG